jgi:hypothetical protein
MNALALAALLAAAQDPTFARKPSAAAEGDRVRIEFAASAETDCEVAVLDARGRVVRHLAAGLLGRNAPEPFQKGALAQTLHWDRKDDRGRPAGAGPFSVRVGLGLKPALERFIATHPAAMTSVRALATGPGGELFVFHVYGSLHPNDGTVAGSVFSREGKYLRTILPYPAGLPDERLRGVRRIERPDGAKVPFLYQGETRSLLPGAGDIPSQRAVATRDGRVAFVGVQEVERYARPGTAQVVVIRSDGSAPEPLLRTKLSESSPSGASLALSPDEKTVYAAGLREGGGADGKPTHAVYAFGWTDPAPRLFAGDPAQSGAGETRLHTPRSVAVAADGTVVVADKGNDRVAAFRPDGSFAGALAVEKPERVEVHPRTGALYVLGGPGVNVLQKFASLKDAKPAATSTLPTFKHERYTAVMALDGSAEPPVLWVGTHQGAYAKFVLFRIEDSGAAFGAPAEIARKADGPGAVSEVNYDPASGRLFTSGGGAFDAATGEAVTVALPKLHSSGPTDAIGLDGNFYLYRGYPVASVSRFGPDLKPLPFEKGEKIGELGSPRVRGRGLTADAQGNVYVLWQKPDRGQWNALAVYGPDGAEKNKKLVDAEIRSLNSVRVDYAGNVYLALGLRPGKDLVPPALRGKVPDAKGDPDAVKGLNYYPLVYGSIAKFGPEGGEIRPGAGGTACNYGWGTPIDVKGARWIVPGASTVPSWRTPGTPDICLCESLRFDVDGYGRSFFPDSGLFRVGVLDTNGNEVAWFGTYGNPDARGPEIPLWWPHAVAVGDRVVFVADRLNRRIARVRLDYRAEAVAPVP